MDKHYNYCCRYNINNEKSLGVLYGNNMKLLLRDVRDIIRRETLKGRASTFKVENDYGQIMYRCCYIEPNGFRYSIKGYKQYVP